MTIKRYHVPTPLLWLIPLALVVIIFFLLELFNITHVFHSEHQTNTTQTPTAGGASVNNDKGEPTNTTGASSSSSQPGDDKSNQGGASSATLVTPSGTFVSNHHPNLSGSPAPNTIASVCTTTPGASCKIVFTQGSINKALTPETTDRSGSAYWAWSLQDLGLTTGTWQVTATATLGTQTVSTNDTLALEVAP